MRTNTTIPRFLNVLKCAICRSGVPDVLWYLSLHPIFSMPSQHNGVFTTLLQPHLPSRLTLTLTLKAKATVKSMKKIIQTSWCGSHLDETKLAQALLQYQNTPSRRDGLSPAQKHFGHPIKDTIPAHRRAFAPEW